MATVPSIIFESLYFIEEDGSDTTAVNKEEIKEQTNVLKDRHAEVKKWLKENPEVQKEYEDFPIFWQELNEWPKWNDLLKKYTEETEAKKRKLEPEEETAMNANDWRKRGTGWGKASEYKNKNYKFTIQQPKNLEGLATCTANGLMPPIENEILHIRLLVEEYDKQLEDIDKIVEKYRSNPTRPPSPPPIYDENGNKINTLKQRIYDNINKQRTLTMQKLIDMNPLQALGISRTQITKKIYIPVKEYPNYNFMGLIIGPRATTLKAMEAESGCQIHVAGKGSLRGKLVRPEAGIVPDEDELHVFIAGDTQEKVNKAVEIVSKLLVPQNTQAINELRKNQLRELAKIQGTIIQESYCSICGQKGHNQYECPSRQKTTKTEIRCAICGDLGHLTSDCKFRTTSIEADKCDTEYMDFMKELGVADGDGGLSFAIDNKVTTNNNWINPVMPTQPVQQPQPSQQQMQFPGMYPPSSFVQPGVQPGMQPPMPPVPPIPGMNPYGQMVPPAMPNMPFPVPVPPAANVNMFQQPYYPPQQPPQQPPQ